MGNWNDYYPIVHVSTILQWFRIAIDKIMPQINYSILSKEHLEVINLGSRVTEKREIGYNR